MTNPRNPWDAPPLAKRGNRSIGTLFEAKGRALDAWENIESVLAHLYSAYTTEDQFTLNANLDYGAPNTVSLRLSNLKKAATTYFVAHPSQGMKSEFDRLADLVQKYSARRNDIAHGIARPFDWIITPASRGDILRVVSEHEWCLIPPHYRPKTRPNAPAPAFLLTSREINAFAAVFYEIARAISNLSLWAIRHAPPSPYIRPRPSALPYTIPIPRILRE